MPIAAIERARRAVRAVRALVERRRDPLRSRPAPPAPSVALDDVRRRLELLLAALYGRPIPIEAAPTPPRPGWWRRVTRRAPSERAPVAASDDARVRLPRTLTGENAVARYRLLAVEHAERLARGTALAAPDEHWLLERDLFLLSESAAVDAAIVRRAPGLRPTLLDARADALAARAAMDGLTPAEREVERLIRMLLTRDPARGDDELPVAPTPAESRAWAREASRRIARATGGAAYRGIETVTAWGTVLPVGPPARSFDPYAGVFSSRWSAVEMRTTAAGARGRASEQSGAGRANEAPPESQRKSEGGADESRSDAGAGAGGSETPSVLDAAASGAAPATSRDAAGATAATEGIAYPEWDATTGRHRTPGAIVRLQATTLGDPRWATETLARRASLVRQLRERFERLRPRRRPLRQQRHGDELDLDACVRALVERRAGQAPDDRLYIEVRPARRELAILLLIDVSGSTSEHVDPMHRIIDVARVAVLLAGEALDALGDRYAMLTFSGTGWHDVHIRTLKGFGELNGDTVRRRIAALGPEGYTRLGAAVRHATALLARETVGHRLLLILSDGKPNDMDGYDGAYAIADSRQAIAEARAAGVYPFCLTIDREAHDYLATIFGPAGHAILRRPEQMPTALVRVVRMLLTS